MPGLADPLWLVLLGVVPLIRWLHRFRAPQTSRTVSALFLWAGSRREQAAGIGASTE